MALQAASRSFALRRPIKKRHTRTHHAHKQQRCAGLGGNLGAHELHGQNTHRIHTEYIRNTDRISTKYRHTLHPTSNPMRVFKSHPKRDAAWLECALLPTCAHQMPKTPRPRAKAAQASSGTPTT